VKGKPKGKSATIPPKELSSKSSERRNFHMAAIVESSRTCWELSESWAGAALASTASSARKKVPLLSKN